MARTFSTTVQFNQLLEPLIEKSVKDACEKLLGKLQELIMSEFYDVYDSITYARTMQFYNSALTEMLSKTMGSIFMDESKMDYPFSGVGWAWTGAMQLEAANQGSHGGWSTDESRNHRFWDSFENYCNKNAKRILKESLIANGVPIV